MTTDPQTDRLDELRAEYANTGMVTSDGAVWLISQVVVLRERLAAAAVPVAAPPTTEQTAEARCAVCRRSGDDSHPAVCFPPAPADRAATLREAADAVAALDRRKAVIYADTIKDAWEEGRDEGAALLRRLAVEAGRAGGPSRGATEPQPAKPAQPEPCAHCGKTILRISGTLAEWWVHDPSGHTVCFPEQTASSPRATPAVPSRPGTEQEA